MMMLSKYSSSDEIAASTSRMLEVTSFKSLIYLSLYGVLENSQTLRNDLQANTLTNKYSTFIHISLYIDLENHSLELD